jgi:hypothetical protein
MQVMNYNPIGLLMPGQLMQVIEGEKLFARTL